MARVTGSYAVIKTHDETVRAFVPAPLPPAAPALDQAAYLERNRLAEVALARLTGMAGLVASSEWLIYSAVRQEALLTSQLEGT